MVLVITLYSILLTSYEDHVVAKWNRYNPIFCTERGGQWDQVELWNEDPMGSLRKYGGQSWRNSLLLLSMGVFPPLQMVLLM